MVLGMGKGGSQEREPVDDAVLSGFCHQPEVRCGHPEWFVQPLHHLLLLTIRTSGRFCTQNSSSSILFGILIDI